MQIDRRRFLGCTAGATLAGAAILLGPMPALALNRDEAVEFVRVTMKEVTALVESAGSGAEKAGRLRRIMEKRGAMPEIARFVAGPVWHRMNEAQQSRFVDAFSGFVSAVYARRFQEYSGAARQGELFTMGTVVDAGRKGLLVKTSIERAGGGPIAVDWLVSDQPGRVVIADIVIEGISLLVTQREEIGSMLEARGGDVDKLIDHLASA
ncbi:MAG TPA: ABC transporter substrate-binding protein [Thermohalobaculum sp.]|nr:ABC transporter substrate-binding protein [Thermohalobaculum sp.]